MKKINLIIKGKPVIKKNSRPIMKNRLTGKFFLGKSIRLREAEKKALKMLIIQRAEKRIKTIDFKINIKFSFYLSDKRRADLSNLYQLPEDILEKAKIISNDYLICGHDGSRRLLDRKNPRTEIEITKFIT